MSTLRQRLNAFYVSDIRGLADLVVHGTRDVAAVVEGVHRSIHDTLGLRQGAGVGRTSGVTGLVYSSVDGITRLTAAGLDASLALAEPLARRLGHEPASSEHREILFGALNGVLGDHLAATGNPLALPMTLHHADGPVDWGAAESIPMARGKVMLMIHGLCMTEHCWTHGQGAKRSYPIGDVAVELGYTPIALRYNSGQSIAENGRELAEQLEVLLARWPVAIEDLTLLGHSMGGLLARSAIEHGEELGHAWTGRLRHLVCLGTPHHGAPLERAGAWIDALLDSTPHTRPFAGLSRRRSRGIQDLGRARIGPEAEAPRSGKTGNFTGLVQTQARALPERVRTLAIAGTLSKRADSRVRPGAIQNLVGDGLVPINSALDLHPECKQDFDLPEQARVILSETSHMDMLHSAEACRQFRDWIRKPQCRNAPERSVTGR